MHSFTRDRSVCTEAEMRSRWSGASLTALDDILQKAGTSFDAEIKDHNPIYYIAQEVLFHTKRHDPTFLYAPYHRDIICRNAMEYYLDGETHDNGLILLGPRDTYKSTLFHGALPIWILLREYHLNQEFVRLALIHHKDRLATRNLNRLRRILAYNVWFNPEAAAQAQVAAIWPEFHATETVLGSSEELYLPCATKGGGAAEPNIEAAGMGGSLTGSHYKAIITSDPVTEDHRSSKTLRDVTEEKHEAMEFLLDTVGGKRMYDGTRYHPRDLWGKLTLAHDAKASLLYRTLCIQAGGSRVDKPLAHPFKWSEEALERKRSEFISKYGNDDFWWLQLQNEVRSERMVATDVRWLKFCKEEDINPRAFGLITVDPAWKGTDSSGEGDSASIQAWFLERKGSVVTRTLADGVHSNSLTMKDGMDAIFGLARKYGILFIAPEQIGGSGIRKVIEDEAITRGHGYIQCIKLKDNHHIAKTARISSFVAEAQAGRVFICEDCDEETKRALLDQFADFGSLDHDDALDNAANTCDTAVREKFIPKMHDALTTSSERAMAFYTRGQEARQAPRTRYSGA